MRYWLFKSEPSTFSISDLAKRPQQTEPWDGVRNYQARNRLRDEIKINDLAFFYHSNCHPPGICGIIRIAKEGYPDTTAEDPASQYYDPDQHTKIEPRWWRVDVQLVETFEQLIPLNHLKTIPSLKQMELLRPGSRLSITQVSPQEWQTIIAISKTKS